MEVVEEIRLGARWDANDVRPPILTASDGLCDLRLGPHHDDEDQRDVVLRFHGVRHASIGSPNDEGRPAHRLWNRGLDRVLWAGVVRDSELVAAINRSSALSSALSHWVIELKGSTVEVVGTTFELNRE